MRNILAIIGRELRSYFASPIAYAVMTLFVFICGMVFVFYLGVLMQASSMRAMQSAQMGGADGLDVPGNLIRYFLSMTATVLLFMTPIMTMSLFSEEKKRGTMELLLTSPITDLQIVLGKFFGAVSFLLILLASTWALTVFLYIYGSPATKPLLTAYLGIVLYGLAILAIGMFISTLTESQVVAAFISFGVSLILLLMDGFGRLVDNATLKSILEYMSIFGHLDDFLRGVVSTTNVIFYLSLTVLGLFLTYRSIDSLRWRG